MFEGRAHTHRALERRRKRSGQPPDAIFLVVLKSVLDNQRAKSPPRKISDCRTAFGKMCRAKVGLRRAKPQEEQKTMKAAVLRKAGVSIEVEEVQINKPGPHEVLVRTAAAGLCHSDLHFIVEDDRIAEPRSSDLDQPAARRTTSGASRSRPSSSSSRATPLRQRCLRSCWPSRARACPASRFPAASTSSTAYRARKPARSSATRSARPTGQAGRGRSEGVKRRFVSLNAKAPTD